MMISVEKYNEAAAKSIILQKLTLSCCFMQQKKKKSRYEVIRNSPQKYMYGIQMAFVGFFAWIVIRF